VAARRKLDQAALERIVAGKAAGESDRQIAVALGVSHTTVSRRVRGDRELQAWISTARKRKVRTIPKRGRTDAAVAVGGGQGRPLGVPASQVGRPAEGIEREMWDRAMQVVQAHRAAPAPPPVIAPPVELRQLPAAPAPAPSWLRLLGFTSEQERYAYYEQRSLISAEHLFDWHDVRADRLTPTEQRTLQAHQ
jgi:hypothetical protein